ncbi:MAG: zf-HC2 domain-containing protein [bacterium]
MSSPCDHIKDRLPAMLDGSLEPEEQKEITRHLSHCPSCSEYERALRRDDERLITLAESMKGSVRRIEAGVGAALEESARPDPAALDENTRPDPAVLEDSIRPTSRALGRDVRSDGAASGQNVPPRPAAHEGFWRWIMTRRRSVYAVAAVIAVLVVWAAGRLPGVFKGTTPAFADVAAQIARARSVSYRQAFQVEVGESFTTRVIATEPGLLRTAMPMGDVIIRDFNSGKSLHLFPAQRRALLQRFVGAPERKLPYNYLDWLESLHKEGATFIRKDRVGDRDVNVFVNQRDPYTKTTVWADAETDLPVRIEHVAEPAPNKDLTVPEISLSEADFGGSPAYTQSISQSGPGIVKETTITKDEFQWYVAFDDSLFRLTPPEGYALERWDIDTSPDDDARLVEALTLWTGMTQGAFPETIDDLCDDEKVRPLLVAKYNGDGDPKDELKAAMAAANVLIGGLYFAQEKKLEGTWHYAGKNVRVGDADTPVCWWKAEDSDCYRVIYGDLRLADITEDDLPK